MKLLLLFLFGVAASGFGQMAQFEKIMVSGRGFPEAGATITVCSSSATLAQAPVDDEGNALAMPTLVPGCSPKVTIYTSPTGTAQKNNPFLTDGLGNAVFYAPPGVYTYSITGPTVNSVLRTLVLPCVEGNCDGVPINIYHNGSFIGKEPGVNFIDGSNITMLPFTDNTGLKRIELQINATGLSGVLCPFGDSCDQSTGHIVYTLHATSCISFPYQPDSEFHASFADVAQCPGSLLASGAPLFIPAELYYSWTQSPPAGYTQYAERIDITAVADSIGANFSDPMYRRLSFNTVGSIPPLRDSPAPGWASIADIGQNLPTASYTVTAWTGTAGTAPPLGLIKAAAMLYSTNNSCFPGTCTGIEVMHVHDVYLTIHLSTSATVGCQATPCSWQVNTPLSFLVENSTAPVGSEPILNLIPGSGVSLTTADNTNNSRIDATFTVSLTQTTVGALPAASSSVGTPRIVTDSTAITSEGQTCVGGGSTKALAFSNGASWKCL